MVDLFFEKIIVVARPTKFYRLGKPDPNKIRPLKLEMVNNTDRDAVMKILKLLKGTDEELGKLSVREDYTKNEREQIKKLVDIAKDKNAEDCSYHWVVRGTPKNGLRLGETHQALTSPNKSFNTINKETNTSIYMRESSGG